MTQDGTGGSGGGTVDARLTALPDEKRQRIVDAGVDEFSAHGYAAASTNAITERAGISKGLLFHYFGSKRGLYLYLLDYIADYFFAAFDADTSNAPGDIWARMTWWSMEKLRMYQMNPRYYAFFSKAFFAIPKGLEQDMAVRYKKLTDWGFGVFLKDIDTSGFRPDIDHAKAIEVIVMTLDGLGRKYMEQLKDNYDFERLLGLRADFEREINAYLDILKAGICDPAKLR